MNTRSDFWGQDIALDADGQAKVAASGELILTDGVETGLQDIRLRLFTRLGMLFYDEDFGSLVHDWIFEESTEANRAAFCSEVVMRVEADPRVELGSVSCSVLQWDKRHLTGALDVHRRRPAAESHFTGRQDGQGAGHQRWTAQ